MLYVQRQMLVCIDVFGPRVTLLAVSSGDHRIPQPQASRHALSTCDSNLLALFSIMPAQAQQAYAFTPNAPSRGLYRPLNIMYGNYAQLSCGHVGYASHHTLTVRALAPHNLHYIKWPQPPRCGLSAAASSERTSLSPVRFAHALPPVVRLKAARTALLVPAFSCPRP